MQPTLLVLAAGMGSRYGGLKQVDAMGPSGETIIDYSIYDAKRAGFGKVVFVIRRDIEQEFKERFYHRISEQIPCELVYQGLDVSEYLPDAPDREKPWGTAHAVLVARDAIAEPFAVINADDFYGAESYALLTEYLQALPADQYHHYAMVGYKLNRTLSEHGTVNRGVGETDGSGFLTEIVERKKIGRGDDGRIYQYPPDQEPVYLPEETSVSMNMFGFTPPVFEHIETHFRKFLREHGQEEKAELTIPDVLNVEISRSEIAVKVLPTDGDWFGVTYREDKPAVTKKLQDLIAQGAYPEKLWG